MSNYINRTREEEYSLKKEDYSNLLYTNNLYLGVIVILVLYLLSKL